MKFNLLIAGLLISGATFGQTKKKPKLVVGLVVDQMRYDYLDRFYDDFSEGGFKRLLNEGFNCKNVHYNYKPTYTGPGHASIFTGVAPAVHGIVGNYWYDQSLGKSVYCVKVGTDQNPSRLLVKTLADEMKQFSNFESKSFGISLKDRGAILPAGHLADGAYWFNSKQGQWISNQYYQKDNPDWLKKFNGQDFERSYLANGWKLLKDSTAYSESWPDRNTYENKLSKTTSTVFPYDLKKAYADIGWGVLKRIPQGNQMSADLFKKLMQEEALGRGETTDFVSLSFSATDYIGHRFGVQSVEVQDTYLRLDLTIANLLTFLDEEVGRDGYVLFLTSDHGASMPLAYLEEKGIVHGKIDEDRLEADLNAKIYQKFGDSTWVQKMINLNVYLNEELKEQSNEKYLEVMLFTKTWLQQQDGIDRVVENGTIVQSTDDRVNRTLRGIHSDRSGDLIMIEAPNWISYSKKGSTHGSPYAYDTHVPLIFFGSGIEQGESVTPYAITSIAPTVSFLIGVSMNHASGLGLIKEILK